MPRKVNATKAFNWRIEIAGLDTFECQTCTLSSPETEAIEQGGGNVIQKSAGMVNVSETTFGKLKPMDAADSFAWDWFNEVQNTRTGNGNEPSFYERDVIIKLMKPDNVTAAYVWELKGCWIKKIEIGELSKTASENVIETITLCVDDIQLIQTPQAA